MNLEPTQEELAELGKEQEVPVEEKLAAEYDELLRDKRSADQLPCDTWDWYEGGSCHCHMIPNSPHEEPIHGIRHAKHWCVAHQSTECDEPHKFITFDQYKKRRLAEWQTQTATA